MSWLAKLYETYEEAWNNPELKGNLEPYYHASKQCHIEITIDNKGDFIRAESLVKEVKYGDKTYFKGVDTIIPITPKSLTGRTSGPAPYPLAEQIQYIAKDYAQFGGEKKPYFEDYWMGINEWVSSEYSRPKVEAVVEYVRKGKVVEDLVNAGVLFVASENNKNVLITNWAKQGPIDGATNRVKPKPNLLNAIGGNDQGGAVVRWRVQSPGDPDDLTWGDNSLVEAWQSFQNDINKTDGFCQLTGQEKFIANTHPKSIHSGANDAKIVSVPTDQTYLTYQGRFTDQNQPCPISFEASQKAHNALRWLISKQGSKKNKEQVYVTWAVSGKSIPDPLESSFSLLGGPTSFQGVSGEDLEDSIDHTVDLGESFSRKFNNYLAGYSAKFDLNEQIIILGLDSVTKGRMSIIYYRTLLASEFFKRLESWHLQFAWPQRHVIEIEPSGKSQKPQKRTIWPVSSPIPRIITEAAYGDVLKSNDTLKKNLLERIMPAIVDGQVFPKDIMMSAVRRARNRNNCEHWEWERNLGVACALYRGFYQRQPEQQRREYSMALEESRNTRDYLFGRLLAVAERIEEMALYFGGESRLTTAARLMKRFSDRPFSTWQTIEEALVPYKSRIQAKAAGLLEGYMEILGQIHDLFNSEDYKKNERLSGEYLLGYHCQRTWLRERKRFKGQWVLKEPGELEGHEFNLVENEKGE